MGREIQTEFIFDLIEKNSMFLQFGKIRIFLSFRFYVKSILKAEEVQKMPFLAILRALNLAILGNFSLQKVQKFIKPKFRASKCVEMADFALLESRQILRL